MSFLNPREYLPHEPPMVLLNKVLEVSTSEVKALVNFGLEAPQVGVSGVPMAWALEVLAQAAAVLIAQGASDKAYAQGRLIRVKKFQAWALHLDADTDYTANVLKRISGENGVFLFEGTLATGSRVVASSEFTLLVQ